MLKKTGTDRWGPDIDTSRVKNGITHSFDLHFFDYLDKCHFTFEDFLFMSLYLFI